MRFFVSYKFDKKFRLEMVECFQECYSLTISEEQADEYLDSLTDLFLEFNSMRE